MRKTNALCLAMVTLMMSTPASGFQRRGAPDLARYADKYPSDAVAGVRFLNHPTVRAAAQNAAPNARIRRQILREGTSAPIAVNNLMVLSHACEPHNCGPHQWAILIGRRTPVHIICYQADGEELGRWYRRGRQIATGQGCASEPQNVPEAVRSQL